ncbi:hypothetical protein [Nostoc sp. NMS7]|uniref:hypothetical protein n=1 Tax=Nostoc sp. NMS7 TaxID=2815391 RepID=UPI00345779E7
MAKPPSKRKKATSAASTDSTSAANSVNEDISQEVDPGSATINVTAVEVPELTEQEISDRLHLERKVERAFFEAGKALMELRDRRLYRSTHKTFEEYCRSRFGYTRMAATYKIAAATVMENLSTIGLQNAEITTDGLQPPQMSTIGLQNVEMSTSGLQILPTNERQVRSLVALEPEVQRTAWQQAVQEAGGKVPTGRIVKDVVQRIMERTKVPNTYQLGEVCQILAKDNPELRGKGGCWAIVSAVNEFSCTVTMWDSQYAVGLQATSEVLQLSAPGVSADAVLERSHYTSVFRFTGGDSQKSVAVIGEGKSALSYCCGRETFECCGVRIRA